MFNNWILETELDGTDIFMSKDFDADGDVCLTIEDRHSCTNASMNREELIELRDYINKLLGE